MSRLVCTMGYEEACKATHCTSEDGSRVEPLFLYFGRKPFSPSFHLDPGHRVLVLTDGSHFEGTNSKFVVTPMRWGLSRKMSDRYLPKKFHITEIEKIFSIQDSGTQKLVNHYPGVVICEGYFEWQYFRRGNSQPYYFYNTKKGSPVYVDNTLYDKTFMTIAAFVTTYKNDNNETRPTCSIVTRKADNNLTLIHDRMPVIFNSMDAAQAWVDTDVPFKDKHAFLKRYDGKTTTAGDPTDVVLKYHRVDRRYCNKTYSYEGSQSIERSVNPQQKFMSDWIIYGRLCDKKK